MSHQANIAPGSTSQTVSVSEFQMEMFSFFESMRKHVNTSLEQEQEQMRLKAIRVQELQELKRIGNLIAEKISRSIKSKNESSKPKETFYPINPSNNEIKNDLSEEELARLRLGSLIPEEFPNSEEFPEENPVPNEDLEINQGIIKMSNGVHDSEMMTDHQIDNHYESSMDNEITPILDRTVYAEPMNSLCSSTNDDSLSNDSLRLNESSFEVKPCKVVLEKIDLRQIQNEESYSGSQSSDEERLMNNLCDLNFLNPKYKNKKAIKENSEPLGRNSRKRKNSEIEDLSHDAESNDQDDDDDEEEAKNQEAIDDFVNKYKKNGQLSCDKAREMLLDLMDQENFVSSESDCTSDNEQDGPIEQEVDLDETIQEKQSSRKKFKRSESKESANDEDEELGTSKKKTKIHFKEFRLNLTSDEEEEEEEEEDKVENENETIDDETNRSEGGLVNLEDNGFQDEPCLQNGPENEENLNRLEENKSSKIPSRKSTIELDELDEISSLKHQDIKHYAKDTYVKKEKDETLIKKVNI